MSALSSATALGLNNVSNETSLLKTNASLFEKNPFAQFTLTRFRDLIGGKINGNSGVNQLI